MDIDRASLKVTCPSCPLQIEGVIAGKSLYYRARHKRWAIWYPWDGRSTEDADFSGTCTIHEEDSLGFALNMISSLIRRVEEAAYLGIVTVTPRRAGPPSG